MALKADEKPMMPATPIDQNHIQCADAETCRKPGRMWVEGMEPKSRICVEHYYARIERREKTL